MNELIIHSQQHFDELTTILVTALRRPENSDLRERFINDDRSYLEWWKAQPEGLRQRWDAIEDECGDVSGVGMSAAFLMAREQLSPATPAPAESEGDDDGE